MRLDPRTIVVPIDTAVAFQHVKRNAAIDAAAVVPAFAHALAHWYGESTNLCVDVC